VNALSQRYDGEIITCAKLAQMGRARCFQLLPRPADAVNGFPDVPRDTSDRLLIYGGEELILGGKVVVERSYGDGGTSRNVA